MLERLKVRITDLKYDWQHAPKKQRSSLISIGVIMICICVAWFALAQVQDDLFAGGDVSATDQQQNTDAQNTDNDNSNTDKTDTNTDTDKDKDSSHTSIDLSVMEVQNHAKTGIQLDKLPRVAAPFANRCEQTIQALLDSQFASAPGAKAFFDERAHAAVVPGETDAVAFTVQIVDANDRELLQLDMSYIIKSHAFGITSALKPAIAQES